MSSVTINTILQKSHSPGEVVGPQPDEHVFKFTGAVSPRRVKIQSFLGFKKPDRMSASLQVWPFLVG